MSDVEKNVDAIQVELAELRGELHHAQCRASAFEAGNRAMEASLIQLRSDNSNLVDRNALLRQRPDLPVDRIPAHEKLVELQATVAQQAAEIERLKQVMNFQDAVACVFDCLKQNSRQTDHPEWGPYLFQVAEEVIAFAPEYQKDWKELAKVGADLMAAKREIDELKVDKARLDFWQKTPEYVGGILANKPQRWSFLLTAGRSSGTGLACYGDTLREALDQLQVMHADLTKHTDPTKRH